MQYRVSVAELNRCFMPARRGLRAEYVSSTFPLIPLLVGGGRRDGRSR